MKGPAKATPTAPTSPLRILILYHCKANTGYAIETLERVFWNMAVELTKNSDDVFLS